MDLPPLAATGLDRRVLFKAGAVTAGLVALGVATSTSAMATTQQDSWRWCNRCGCLFFSGNPTTGWCTLGGGHDWTSSGDYLLSYGSGSSGEDGWVWCHKCQTLWFGGKKSSGHCPSGGGHSRKSSADYVLAYGLNPGGKNQGDWCWCDKCYCLWYLFTGRHCPAGGGHAQGIQAGIASFYLPYE